MVNWTLDIQVLDRQDLGNADFIQFQNFTQEAVATDDFGELSSRAIGVLSWSQCNVRGIFGKC